MVIGVFQRDACLLSLKLLPNIHKNVKKLMSRCQRTISDLPSVDSASTVDDLQEKNRASDFYRKKNEKHNWDVQVTQLSLPAFFAPVAWCICIPPVEGDVDMPQKKSTKKILILFQK